MPRSTVAIFSGTITAVTMALAIVVGGLTAGAAGHVTHVADDPGTTTTTTTPPPSTSSSDDPDSDGHGWID